MSEYPSHWRVAPFCDLVTLRRGVDLPVQDREGGEIPIFGSNGIVGSHSRATQEHPGIVTGRSGSIGNVYLIRTPFWALNTTLYSEQTHGNNIEYIFHFLKWFDLSRFSGGTGVPTLNRNDVHDQPIGIPPLPEQKKIAEILSGIDDEINKFKNKIEALAFLKKSTANILIHQERFPLVSLQEVLGNGGSIQDGDWIESKDQDQDGKIRLVQLADIQEGRFIQKSSRFMNQDKADALNVTFLKKGDLLIARMPDPIGRSCIFPGSEQDCVTIVDIAILRSSMCNMEWLMHAINTSAIRNQIEELATGTTRKRISRGRLSEIYIPHPEKADQDQIAMHISSTETAIATLQVRLEKTMLLKSAIAADLLSGRTRVSV